MLRAGDYVLQSALSQLKVSKWPLWETNGERHAANIKTTTQYWPGLIEFFFFSTSISTHFPCDIWSVVLITCEMSLCVWWEMSCLAREVSADWLKPRSDLSRSFWRVYFAAGRWKESRWQEDGQPSLSFRERWDCSESATPDGQKNVGGCCSWKVWIPAVPGKIVMFLWDLYV